MFRYESFLQVWQRVLVVLKDTQFCLLQDTHFVSSAVRLCHSNHLIVVSGSVCSALLSFTVRRLSATEG